MNAIIDLSYPPREVDSEGLDRLARKFRDSIFSQHEPVRPLLSKTFRSILKRRNLREASLSLVDFNEKMVRGDLWLSMDDNRLREWCTTKAHACKLTVSHRGRSALSVQRRIFHQLNKYELKFPYSKRASKPYDLYHGFIVGYNKVSDPAWWKRQVRNLQKREMEEYQRSSGVVHHKSQIYASDYAVENRRNQKARNRALLSEIKCTNQLGDEYWLDELQALSVANPALRRAELMTRIAGFEKYANRLGYVGEFLTITCPSKYHSTHIWGEPNEKYQGYTAREANNYLCELWAAIRSKLHRNDIDIFGFRVSEPHHDGCPHWHFLLFMPAESAEFVASTCKEYAFRVDGAEPGARKYRFKRVCIDPERGSAAGYIAKYVSKNIDGAEIDSDLFGNDAIESANRIDAWASTHGIRQFQQIGGPSVTVWRELRRLDQQEQEEVEGARLAADTANWADFCEIMGSGRNQLIKLLHWQEIDAETGEIDPIESKYEEPVPGKIFGLIFEGKAICTRFYTWALERTRNAPKAGESKSILQVRPGIPTLFGIPLPKGFDFDLQGANAPPWSSVNNCTAN